MSDTTASEPKPERRTSSSSRPSRAPPRSTSRAKSRAYLTWFTILTIAITSVWGAVLGILLPNQVQLLEMGNWFTGRGRRASTCSS